jgi:epoxyqueuosine reductase
MEVSADQSNLKEKLREKAFELGFELFGVTSIDQPKSFDHYRNWVDTNKHASMEYMQRNQDVRSDPRLILPEAKSIICLGAFYSPPKESTLISSYALGDDYHKVLKKRLKTLEKFSKDELGIEFTRSTVDTAPILERDLAERAGIGWIGKNTLLINQYKGSYFFISELFISTELPKDLPAENHCGNCTSCIDACPTDALKPYELDSNKCISYWTIEHRGDFPAVEEFGEHIFGCDICQTACPWNRFSEETKIAELSPNENLMNMNLNQLKDLSELEFNEIFVRSPLKRTKYEGFMRNVKNALSSKKLYLSNLLNTTYSSPLSRAKDPSY